MMFEKLAPLKFYIYIILFFFSNEESSAKNSGLYGAFCIMGYLQPKPLLGYQVSLSLSIVYLLQLGCIQTTSGGLCYWLKKLFNFFQCSWLCFFRQLLRLELPQPKRTGLAQMNEKTCVFARSPDWVWMRPSSALRLFMKPSLTLGF